VAQAALVSVDTFGDFKDRIQTSTLKAESLESFQANEITGQLNLSVASGVAISFAKVVDIDAAAASWTFSNDSADKVAADISGNASITNASGASAGGRAPVHGSNYLQGGTSSGIFQIDFADAITAFGFWGSDIGDFLADNNCVGDACTGVGSSVLGISFYLDNVLVGDEFPLTGSSANASSLFWGFVDSGSGFDRVVFRNMTIGGLTVDGQGFDLFMIADARDTPNGQVPEPSGLLLAAVALLGLARVSRRRI
jgi:hypothetical protein